MIYLFRIYQWLIATPILLVLTFLTCIVTFVSCFLFGKSWGGYYPPCFGRGVSVPYGLCVSR